jgi:hypothetical protein
VGSATALAEPNSRAARRCANDRRGITTKLVAASEILTVELPTLSSGTSARTVSTVTYAANAKKETAMNRSTDRSRSS